MGNENENAMKSLRENAYKIQYDIQQKESEYRSISDSLRDLKKTDPQYLKSVAEEVDLINDIETLRDELMQNKERESMTFEQLQQCIRNYHQIESEYRERLKRISYSWNIVWIVFSVGIGSIFAYRMRHNF